MQARANLPFFIYLGAQPSLSPALKPAQAQIGVNETLLAAMFQCTVSCPQLYAASKYTDSLHFIAHVPAGGFVSYTLAFDPHANSSTTLYPDVSPVAQTATISNGHVTLDFSPDTGALQRVKTGGGSAFQVQHSYWSYIDPQGGAYCLVEQQAAVQLPQVSGCSHRVCPPAQCCVTHACARVMRSPAGAAHAHHCCCRPRHVPNVADVCLGQGPAPALQAVACIPRRRGVSRLRHAALQQGAHIQAQHRLAHAIAAAHRLRWILRDEGAAVERDGACVAELPRTGADCGVDGGGGVSQQGNGGCHAPHDGSGITRRRRHGVRRTRWLRRASAACERCGGCASHFA